MKITSKLAGRKEKEGLSMIDLLLNNNYLVNWLG